MRSTNDMAKQILLDILIVLALPIMAIFGYFYFKTEDGTKLLSYVSPSSIALPGEQNTDLGSKTKAALTELNSINFDQTFFNDATFLTLQDFTGPILATPIGREYPFTSTSQLRIMNKKEKPSVKIDAITGVIKIPINIDSPQKVDVIKSGVR